MPKTKKLYCKQIIIRLTEKEYETLEQVRKHTGIPFSNLIRKQIPFFADYYGTGNSTPDNTTNS